MAAREMELQVQSAAAAAVAGSNRGAWALLGGFCRLHHSTS